MKNSGIEWIGEIPDGWETKRVKEVFQIIGGCGFKEELQGNVDGEYPFCKASDISGNGKYISTAKNYVNQDLVNSQKYKVIPAYSILMSKIGEAMKKNHRKINTVPCIVDNNCQALVCISVDNLNYLYYVLLHINMSWFDNGGTIPNTNNEKLLNLSLPYPSESIQRQIAEYLDEKCGKIDFLIDNIQTQIEKLKEYKQSLITEAVTKGLDKSTTMKDSGIEWIGEIPEGWEVCKTLFCLEMPITHGPHTTPELFEDGIPFVSAEAISCGNGDIDFSHIRGFISQEFYEECCKKYIPRVGDIYMIKSEATTGRVSIVTTNNIFTIWSPLWVRRLRVRPRF